MTAWTVMLRGIRHRAGRSSVVFVLAALAAAAAVLAPAYSRAAQQSVLTDGLGPRAAAVSADATSLVVAATATGTGTDEIKLTMNQSLGRHPAVGERLGHPVAAVDTDASLTVKGAPLAGRLAYRDLACDHLTITGRCPDAPGQVLVSQRTAAAHGIAAGDQLSVHLGPRGVGRDRTFAVVGLYTPKNSADGYWGRTVYFAAGGAGSEAERVDAILTNDEDDLRADRSASLSTRLEYPLDTGGVRLDDVGALRDGIGALTAELRGADLELTTTLPAVLDEVAADQKAIGRTAPVIAVPLLLLCWFVLFLLVGALTEERAPELALAKLRGYPAGRAARFGLGETLLLVTLAAPVGVLFGLGLVELAAGVLLAPGTAVEARWPVYAAAVVALAGAYTGIFLAGRTTLAQPVLGLLRRVPERAGWRAGVGEGVVVALAGASLVAAAGDRGSPLALLAAPLLAVVAGIGAARLLNLFARARLGTARRRGRLAALLSAAQLARRPGGQRVVVVVTVAVALLSFAATAWDVAAQARRDAAVDRLGADRVLTVSAEHPAALVAAVGRADPDGHSMAVVRKSQRYEDHAVELIGVQADRLAEVADWRGHSRDDLTALAGRLRPGVAAPVPLGKELDVEVGVDGLRAPGPQLRLSAVVAMPGQPPRAVPLGVLSKGLKEFAVTLPGCAGECRLNGFSIGRAAGGAEPFTASLTVRAMHDSTGALKGDFEVPGRWRVATQHASTAQVTVRAGAALAVDIASTDPVDAVIEHVDTPDALPAVLAGRSPADDSGAETFSFPGFAEQPQPFTVAARSTTLPRVGTRGLLFDLDYAVRIAERTASLADNGTLRYEVWAAPGAPADLAARLADAGVRVVHSESISGYEDQLGRRAPALALWLYLLAGAVALLLAVGSVLVTAYVGVAGRRSDYAALRVVGVPAGVLRRALFREYRALLGLPLVLGLAAGVVGAMVMLPGIPLVTVDAPGADLRLPTGFGALPVAVVACVVGLLLAVVLVLRTLRYATPERLRNGSTG